MPSSSNSCSPSLVADPKYLNCYSVVAPNILAGQNNGSFLSTSIAPDLFLWIYGTNMGQSRAGGQTAVGWIGWMSVHCHEHFAAGPGTSCHCGRHWNGRRLRVTL